MRIGIMIGASDSAGLDGLIEQVNQVEKQGFASAWMANIFGLDAINALAIVGRETNRIELGTAVVPTFPRHPFAIAQQALTTQAAAKGRFVLGIGLSHKIVIENMLGMSYTKTARHMREYLSVLAPLLRGEPASFKGEEYSVNASLQVPGATPVPLLVAALGPLLLKVAGELADGTITWMTGPKTLESHIIPTMGAAAAAAGRPRPRTVSGFPMALTNDAAAARQKAGEIFQMYGTLPSYRAMLDREGVPGPGDITMAGDEKELESQIKRLEEIGVTDFSAAPFPADAGAVERTTEFLASKVGSMAPA